MMSFERYEKIIEGKARARYLLAKNSGLLAKKVFQAKKILESCEFCERKCKVNRLENELGFCKAPAVAKVFAASTHFGEENILVPSATIFFAGCTMRCVYCQNAPESLEPASGSEWSEVKIARWMEAMHAAGCKNVNFVGGSPTPYTYNILKALSMCSANIPVVWNSNAYYSSITAELLKGVVDIYLLDFRYFSNKCAQRYSSTPNYVETVKRNMMLAARDSALLVRVLVMPSHIDCCAKPIVSWLAEQFADSENVKINIMSQYWPAYEAYRFEEMNRPLASYEFYEVLDFATELGIEKMLV